ncbi:MAG: flap endonuclease-1 [Thermoprotei archaeon]|nr:MAG: flap endonuclease-1 [Thermoprotei archaeon]
MGVQLAKLVAKRVVELSSLKGRRLAVDANNVLHQFLALVRKPDGSLLTDPAGRVTSHLVGLAFRATRLLYEYDVDLVFVFDGRPPKLKEAEVAKRKLAKEKAEREWREALARGDLAKAFSKAVVTGRLTREMVDDAKRLLKLLGIPFIEAPQEAEAQAAFMASRGDVWASNSRDYDSLLFGSPRLVRYVTISGTEFLPSKGIVRPLKPEIIELEATLKLHGLTREQLVDIAILLGTDFNEGVKGVGPIKALKLIKSYGRLEALPPTIKSKLPPNYEEVREIFLNPKVTADYSISYGGLDEEGLRRFLCDEKGFSEERVETLIERMRAFYSKKRQLSLERWWS